MTSSFDKKMHKWLCFTFLVFCFVSASYASTTSPLPHKSYRDASSKQLLHFDHKTHFIEKVIYNNDFIVVSTISKKDRLRQIQGVSVSGEILFSFFSDSKPDDVSKDSLYLLLSNKKSISLFDLKKKKTEVIRQIENNYGARIMSRFVYKYQDRMSVLVMYDTDEWAEERVIDTYHEFDLLDQSGTLLLSSHLLSKKLSQNIQTIDFIDSDIVLLNRSILYNLSKGISTQNNSQGYTILSDSNKVILDISNNQKKPRSAHVRIWNLFSDEKTSFSINRDSMFEEVKISKNDTYFYCLDNRKIVVLNLNSKKEKNITIPDSFQAISLSFSEKKGAFFVLAKNKKTSEFYLISFNLSGKLLKSRKIQGNSYIVPLFIQDKGVLVFKANQNTLNLESLKDE